MLLQKLKDKMLKYDGVKQRFLCPKLSFLTTSTRALDKSVPVPLWDPLVKVAPHQHFPSLSA